MALTVIGGALKGKRLILPKSGKVRPTSGLVREAVFNILMNEVEDTVVLDVFAGSGALGIEALSRGARAAVFVENDPEAIHTIEQNIRSCGLTDSAKLLRQNAVQSLSILGTAGLMFDLVLMDPPYKANALYATLENLGACGALRPGAIVVAEHPLKPPVDEDACADIGFKLADRRKYGKTLVYFFNYMV